MNEKFSIKDNLNKSTYDYVWQKVRANLCRILEIDINNIHLDSNLKEIGLNSILYIQLIVVIEEELSFEVGDEALDFKKFETVKSIVDYAVEKINL